MASTRKASIAAELRADRAKFKQDLDAAKRDVKAFGDDARKAGGTFDPGAGMARGMSRNWTEINSRATAAKNVVEEIYGAASKPAAANAWYADLHDRLTAVMGSAEAAKKHLGSLRLISDEQSLSDDQFEKIVDYSERLQSLGYSADGAAEFIREMANSAEGMGRGVEAFEPMIMSLDRVTQKADASLKAIIAMSESMPGLRRALEAGFGTSNAKELEAMNLTGGELAEGLKRGMKAQETALPSKNEEALAIATRKKQTLGADAEDNEGKLADRKQMTPEELAAARERMVADVAQREREAAAEKAAAGMKELERQEDLLKLQQDLQKAELKGDKEAVALAEDRLAVMEKAADLAKELGISEEQAAAAIRRQNALRRETADLAATTRTPEQTADMDRTKEQAEIDRLRSRGHDRQADRRQKALDIADETQRLKAQGFSEKDAAAMAEQGQQTKEDQEYFDKTGRNKIRSNPKSSSANLDPNYKPFDPDGSMPYDSAPKVTPARKELAQSQKDLASAQKSGADSEVIGALRDQTQKLEQKLDQLIKASFSKTAGEQTAPSRRD